MDIHWYASFPGWPPIEKWEFWGRRSLTLFLCCFGQGFVLSCSFSPQIHLTACLRLNNSRTALRCCWGVTQHSPLVWSLLRVVFLSSRLTQLHKVSGWIRKMSTCLVSQSCRQLQDKFGWSQDDLGVWEKNIFILMYRCIIVSYL